jgi:hypothetical protein
MTQPSALELAARSYVGFLMALGAIGFGWLLISHSQNMADFFSSGKKSRFGLNARMFAVWGWISLVGGSLTIAIFLILMVIILLQPLWS